MKTSINININAQIRTYAWNNKNVLGECPTPTPEKLLNCEQPTPTPQQPTPTPEQPTQPRATNANSRATNSNTYQPTPTAEQPTPTPEQPTPTPEQPTPTPEQPTPTPEQPTPTPFVDCVTLTAKNNKSYNSSDPVKHEAGGTFYWCKGTQYIDAGVHSVVDCLGNTLFVENGGIEIQYWNHQKPNKLQMKNKFQNLV